MMYFSTRQMEFVAPNFFRTPDVAAFLGTVRWFRAPRALATSARRARAIENVPCGDQEGDFLVEIG